MCKHVSGFSYDDMAIILELVVSDIYFLTKGFFVCEK